MFNFSANHLFLLSRTEYPSCAVFLLRDLDTQRTAASMQTGVYFQPEGTEAGTVHL
jgi:hypothetical protein